MTPETRQAYIRIRLTVHERAALNDLAAHYSTSISAVVRGLIKEHVAEIFEETDRPTTDGHSRSKPCST